MNDNRTPPSRRRFLRSVGCGVTVLAAAGTIPLTVARAQAKLSVDDPTAKALGYVEASAVDGQWCNNCNFWQGGDAEWGGCPIFPGKQVAAHRLNQPRRGFLVLGEAFAPRLQ